MKKRVAEIHPQEKHEEKSAQIRGNEVKTILTQYKVKTGENLASIANKNNTTIKSLRQANNLAGNSVRSGTRL